MSASACKRSLDGEANNESEQPAVRVHAVTYGDVSRGVVATANVDAEKSVDLLSETTGIVESIDVEEGDRVKAGQILCTLANPKAQLALQRSRLERSEIEHELESTSQLNERGYVAKRTRDELVFRLERARIEEQRTLEEVKALRIVAVFAGVIARRYISVGENISPQRKLFQLIDDSQLLAVLHLPESQAVGIEPGLAATATIVASTEQVSGTVLRVAPLVEARSGTMRVTVAFTAHPKLLTGTLVRVRILIEKKNQVLVVPRRAIDLDAAEPYVYRVIHRESDAGQTSIAQRVVVQLGIVDGDVAEILTGLHLGDNIVVAGQSALRDGLTVRTVAFMADEDAVSVDKTTDAHAVLREDVVVP